MIWHAAVLCVCLMPQWRWKDSRWVPMVSGEPDPTPVAIRLADKFVLQNMLGGPLPPICTWASVAQLTIDEVKCNLNSLHRSDSELQNARQLKGSIALSIIGDEGLPLLSEGHRPPFPRAVALLACYTTHLAPQHCQVGCCGKVGPGRASWTSAPSGGRGLRWHCRSYSALAVFSGSCC